MTNKGKWRIFWEQVIEDRELVGTFVIGFLVLLGEFTSVLLSNENITPVSTVPRRVGLLFILAGAVFYFRRSYRTTQWILSTKHLPVVFVVGRPREEAQETLLRAKQTVTRLTGFKEFKQVENSLNVSYQDLLVYKIERIIAGLD